MKVGVLALLVSLVVATPAAAEAAAETTTTEPYGSVGVGLGPGSASWDGAPGRVSGGQGVVFLSRSWIGPWAYGVAAHFWWHAQDTTRTELTVAGPALTWRARRSGPLFRATLGLAYQHNMLEFAQSSIVERLDGAGIAGSAAWEFRLGTHLAIGPEIDAAKLWLPDGRSASFWGGSVELTLYLPLERRTAGAMAEQ